jgi:hypothetical protein
MPKRGFKDRQERSVLLSKLPEGTTRIKVKTALGKTSYRDLADLADSDEILTKSDGSPIVMKSKPGRRKNIVLGPENPTIKEVLKRKDEFVDGDTLRQMMRDDPESPDVLQAVMEGISEEAASIGFERIEADRRGKETGTLSQRRITALRALADTWLKRKEQISTRGIDMDSPAFEEVFKYTMETFKEAMVAARMRPEAVEAVFARFSQMINDEWKTEAKIRMKKLV